MWNQAPRSSPRLEMAPTRWTRDLPVKDTTAHAVASHSKERGHPFNSKKDTNTLILLLLLLLMCSFTGKAQPTCLPGHSRMSEWLQSMLTRGFFLLCVLLPVGEGTHGSEMAPATAIFGIRSAKSACYL